MTEKVQVSVAGMSLGDLDIVQPLSAVVCIKGLDSDGDVAYWSQVTEGLSVTEGSAW